MGPLAVLTVMYFSAWHCEFSAAGDADAMPESARRTGGADLNHMAVSRSVLSCLAR